MIDKLFGILFVIAGIFVVWKPDSISGFSYRSASRFSRRALGIFLALAGLLLVIFRTRA